MSPHWEMPEGFCQKYLRSLPVTMPKVMLYEHPYVVHVGVEQCRGQAQEEMLEGILEYKSRNQMIGQNQS